MTGRVMHGDDGRHGPHPDLLGTICDYVTEVHLSTDVPEDHRLTSPVQPNQLTVRCQYTWHDIVIPRSHWNGGALSACVAQFEQGGDFWSVFIEAVRPPGESTWSIAGSSGGKRKPESRDRAGGFKLHAGAFVLVGGLGLVPDGGTLSVEMADGSTFENRAVDGSCMVLAPVLYEPTPHDHVTARLIDPDGVELAADRVWVGDGGPPPDPGYLGRE